MSQLPIKIHSALYIDESPQRGRGVYTRKAFRANKILEISPVLVLPPEERLLVEKTKLYNYVFEWGDDSLSCIVAFGYLSMYNHSYTSNCEYIMDFERQLMCIKTMRDIKEHEEITINYNGDWDNGKPLWFSAI